MHAEEMVKLDDGSSTKQVMTNVVQVCDSCPLLIIIGSIMFCVGTSLPFLPTFSVHSARGKLNCG